jgi:hypothetical protein
VKWATRRGVHVDRAACAWLIRRFIDPAAEFIFIDEWDEAPADVTAFDMRGADLSHHITAEGTEECSFETFLHRYDLSDPVLWRLAQIVHEADLDDDLFDAPEAAGLDVALRGLAMVGDDTSVIQISRWIFDGLFEYERRALLLGREPS